MNVSRPVTAAAVVAAGVGLVLGAAPASATGRTAGGITICHATRSGSNPYVIESPDAQSIVRSSGHGQHLGDIIPGFDWTDSRGATHRFAGLNVDKLSWIARGCTASTGTSLPGSSGSGGTSGGTTPPVVVPPSVVVPPPVVVPSRPVVVSSPVVVPPPVVVSPPVVVPPPVVVSPRVVVPLPVVVSPPVVVPSRPVVVSPPVVSSPPVASIPVEAPPRPVVASPAAVVPPPVVVRHPADPVRRVSRPTTQPPTAAAPVAGAAVPAPPVTVSRLIQDGQIAAAVVSELPRTGAEQPIPLRGGLGLVLAGGLLLLARRLLRGGHVS